MGYAKRFMVGDLRDALKGVPDRAIVVIPSNNDWYDGYLIQDAPYLRLADSIGGDEFVIKMGEGFNY